MKKVIGILAILAFVSSMASAELLKNVKYNGSIEIKSVTVDNADFNADAEDKYSNTANRAMLGVNFDLSNNVNAQVTAVKYDRYYGDNSANAGQTIDNLTANVRFSEAYLNLKDVIGLNHKVGRQYYGNQGDIAIYYGPSAWNVATYAVEALDAWYGEWKKDKWLVTGIVGKVNEGSKTTMADKDIYGVTAAYDYSEIIKPGAYIYQSDDQVGHANTSHRLNVLGLKATGKYQGLGYGFEYAMNSGTDFAVAEDYTGNAMKLNADYGLDLKEAGKLAFMGEFARGSGSKATNDRKEFNAINHNYVPGLIFGGLGVGAANTGLSNLTAFNVGVKFTPKSLEKLSLCGHFYNFGYTEKVGAVEKIGTELDFAATWKHSEDLMLKASYAMFTPDSDFSANDDAKTLLGLDAVVKF